MKITGGILALVVGLVLVFLGYDRSRTMKGQLDRLFTTTEKNRTTWLYVGGAVLCAAGMGAIYAGRK